MSQPLRRDALEAALAGAPSLALYLDFDGTLAPIADYPEDAVLLPAARAALEQLASHARVAIISGRALSDITRRVGLPLVYAGNHGLEIEGPGFRFVEPRALAAAPALRRLCDCLEARLAGVPGVLVEYKQLTASLHYRRAPAEQVREVAAALHSVVAGFPEFAVSGGHMIFNLRPALDWDKGSAARWIQQRLGTPSDAILCAGDDLTDEDLFAAFPGAATIAVGCGHLTHARWCVSDCEEIAALLEGLAHTFTLPPPR